MEINYNKKAVINSLGLLKEGGVYDKPSQAYALTILIYTKFLQEVYLHHGIYINSNATKLRDEISRMESIMDKWTINFNSYNTILWNNLKLLPVEDIKNNISKNIIGEWMGRFDKFRTRHIPFPNINSINIPLLFDVIDSISILSSNDINEIYETICIYTNTYCHYAYYEALSNIFNSMSELFSYVYNGSTVTDEYGAEYSSDGKWLVKCPDMKEYVIKEGTLYIADYCFCDDRNLEKVVLPKSLKAIGHCAFYCCSLLKSLIIEESIDRIGSAAFNACYDLKITLKNSNYKCCGDMLLSNDGEFLISYWGKDLKLIVPDGVRVLTSYCLRHAIYATSISLPESLQIVRNSAFQGYRGKSLGFLSQVKFIGSMAIGFCRVDVVSLPGNCYINPHAFHKCHRLKRIYLRGPNVKIDSYILEDSKDIESIFVWKKDEEHYRNLLTPDVASYINVR